MPRKIGHSTYSETFTGYAISDDEWEFIKAVAAYQKRWNRRYPSWREVFHVLRDLGYRKVAPPVPFVDPTPGEVALRAEVRAAKPEPAPSPAESV